MSKKTPKRGSASGKGGQSRQAKRDRDKIEETPEDSAVDKGGQPQKGKSQRDKAPTAPKGSGSGTSGRSRREKLRARQQAEAASQARSRRIITVVAALVALLIVVTVVVVVVQKKQAEEQQQTGNAEQLIPANVNAAGNAMVFPGNGDENDPLVTVYADYQCPGCGTASKSIDLLLEQLAEEGEIRLEYHMLHGLDRALGTDHSQRALLAATCAGVTDNFPAYNHQVFDNQPEREGDGWTDEQLTVDFPAAISMSPEDLTTFQTCYRTRQTLDFITTMQTTMPRYVESTPSFVVNDQVMQLTTAEWADKDALLAKIMTYA